MDDRPRSLRWMLSEAKDTSELMVDLAYAAGRAGGTVPAAFNAANEEAVAAFLSGRAGFGDIVATVERVLAAHDGTPADALTFSATGAANIATSGGFNRHATLTGRVTYDMPAASRAPPSRRTCWSPATSRARRP